MNTEAMPKCPQCGALLPSDAPDGLCPKCVMALNLKTETVFTGDSPAAQPPLPSEQIAPHFPQLEILECLGRGGMGVVYKARQKTLNRLVALKLLAPERVHDAKFAERFTREAQALAALNHPNIVTIYDFGQAGGFYFLLMEFVDGANLRQLLRTRKFTPEEALAIVPPLCDALQFAHERGIVHRDIKPENLLLDKSGRVKVADFGIAKIMGGENTEPAGAGYAPTGSHSLTDADKAMGTPGYSAPEQKSDPQRVDSRADIYSLGVVFYEMLTGELPGKKIEAPSRKVQIDVRLDEVVLRALEKTPELRWQTAADLRTQVETIAQTPKSAIQNQPPEIEPRFSRTAIVGMIVPLLLFALAAGLIGVPSPAGGLTMPIKSVMGISAIALLGMCILGWGAVSQIRRSAGMIYGLPLAFGEAMLFPLLALDGLVFLVCDLAAIAVHGEPDLSNRNLAILYASTIVLSLIADLFIIRAVWRAVNKPLNISPTLKTTAPSEKTENEHHKSEIVPRFSRTAIMGVCWAGLAAVAAIWFGNLNGERVGIWREMSTPGKLGFVLTELLGMAGWSATLGTTILGWIAVTQTRRSAGKIYGLGLAVFDGLFFPLLALDSIILVVAANFIPVVNRPAGTAFGDERFTSLGVGVAIFWIVLIVIIDWWICRSVWRAVKQPLDGSPNIPPAKDSSGQPLAGFALLFAGLSGLLGAVTFCFWPNPSMLLVFSIPTAALLGIIFGIQARQHRLGKRAIAIGSVNLGIWLIIAIAVQFSRMNLDQASPAAVAAQNPSFGPVEERVIIVGNDAHSFYSFDRDDYVPGPTDFDPTDVNNNSKLWKWMTENHVDVFARTRDGRPVLIRSEMVATDLNEDDFDRLSPAGLVENPTWVGLLNAQMRPQETSTISRGNLRGNRDTLVFQNRYEVTGLLQVVAVTSNPPGVKIRYKLVQSR